MARQESYTQCRLRRPLRANRRREPGARLSYGLDSGSTIYEVMESWIPAGIAKVGATVRLKELGSSEWSEGWEVLEVWGTRPGDYIEAAVHDHKHQRGESDV